MLSTLTFALAFEGTMHPVNRLQDNLKTARIEKEHRSHQIEQREEQIADTINTLIDRAESIEQAQAALEANYKEALAKLEQDFGEARIALKHQLHDVHRRINYVSITAAVHDSLSEIIKEVDSVKITNLEQEIIQKVANEKQRQHDLEQQVRQQFIKKRTIKLQADAVAEYERDHSRPGFPAYSMTLDQYIDWYVQKYMDNPHA